MIILATMSATAWIWGRAIGFSKRLSPNSWKLVTVISVTILVLSLWGLERSSTKQQEYDYRRSIVVDNSTASSEVWLGRGGASEMVTDFDLSGSCAQAYIWSALGRSAFSQARILTNTPRTFSLNPLSNGQSLGSSATLTWGQSGNANSYGTYFGTSSYPSFTAMPAIAAYNWDSSRSASRSFSLAVSGSNFDRGTKVFVISDMEQPALTVTVPLGKRAPFNVIVMNPNGFVTRYGHLGTSVLAGSDSPVHLHYGIKTSAFATSLDRFFRSYFPPIQVKPVKDRYDESLIFWVSLFGMIVSPISTILSLVLTWISLHRRKAEAILLRLEVERQRLEIEKLRLEVKRMQQESTRETASLLIVPS